MSTDNETPESAPLSHRGQHSDKNSAVFQYMSIFRTGLHLGLVQGHGLATPDLNLIFKGLERGVKV